MLDYLHEDHDCATLRSFGASARVCTGMGTRYYREQSITFSFRGNSFVAPIRHAEVHGKYFFHGAQRRMLPYSKRRGGIPLDNV